MKTIFDWLCRADFRTKPEMFIGHGNLNTLETWINGYADGCFDAGHPECYYYTPNGIPYFLLRDYIALQENDQSVGGIAFILTFQNLFLDLNSDDLFLLLPNILSL